MLTINTILSSILFTNLEIFIRHFPYNNSGLYLASYSNKKELFYCNIHTNFTKLSTKVIYGYRSCGKCKNKSEQCCREILEELTKYKFPNTRNIKWLIN